MSKAGLRNFIQERSYTSTEFKTDQDREKRQGQILQDTARCWIQKIKYSNST